MRIGWVGLGKLGLPAALTLSAVGRHDVTGYDLAERPWRILAGAERYPHREAGVDGLLQRHTVRRAHSAHELVGAADVIFIAVQTPHPPQFDGTRTLREPPQDFTYDHLVDALTEVGVAARLTERPLTVVIVSTVLTGTIDRELRDLVPGSVRLLYQPYFISLGTVVENVRRPPLILVGCDPATLADDREVYGLMRQVYRPVWLPFENDDYVMLRIHVMSYRSAELAKMAYNAHQTLEITYVNWLAELAERSGAHVDDVTEVLPVRYRAGMVDGGACRPRDLVAMAHLESDSDVEIGGAPLAGALLQLRELEATWLAATVAHHAAVAKLPVVILGSAYKPETDLEDGSPALLLGSILRDGGLESTLVTDPGAVHTYERPAVYVIAVRHPAVALAVFPPKSHVIDPWGIIPDQQDVIVRRLGRGGARVR